MLVVPPPGQASFWHSRFLHGGGPASTPLPHTEGFPAPPQISGAVQLPHWRSPPQPSATGPQFAPASAQVRGVQRGASAPPSAAAPVPHTLGPPPPQVWPVGQAPQSSRLPQPSATGPQFAPTWAQVRGMHAVPPHTEG